MKIAQNRICISDPPEMCEETSTAYYGDILDVFETSRTADCWDACDVVKECAFVNFIISTQTCILLRDVNTTMRTAYKQGSTSRLKGCLSKCCEIAKKSSASLKILCTTSCLIIQFHATIVVKTKTISLSSEKGFPHFQ